MIREIQGDIWEYRSAGLWIAVTTNGFVKRNGVMICDYSLL